MRAEVGNVRVGLVAEGRVSVAGGRVVVGDLGNGEREQGKKGG